MAATVDIGPPPPPPPPPPPAAQKQLPPEDVVTIDDIPCIDMSTLTQSELLALCRTSRSYFDPCREEDLVTPTINRSVFNESAGSRRQTYSRVRLGHSHHRTTRISGLPRHPKSESSPSVDPENLAILHYLKHFLNYGPDSTPPPPPPPPPPPAQQEVVPNYSQKFEMGLGFEVDTAIGENAVDYKQKRGPKGKGKRRLMENGVGIELQKVNKKGELVDFSVLESNGDNLYEEELKKRTSGLENEEQVLGFLTNLEGQWCSRRKRRKYVDASEFGDALPIGWKILLGLRRRDYRVSVYCRRYISPTGQQFISCKEAALFLQSQFVFNDVKQRMDQRPPIMQQSYDMISTSNAGASHIAADVKYDNVEVAIIPYSGQHESEASLVCLDNLAEVEVHDLFECYKCNLSFDEKNAYLQHLFSFHQQTTKRLKFDRPVGEGVIIRDGKFECQFCHKIFEERRKYNGHVGVHVRNRGFEDLSVVVTEIKSSESLTQEGLALQTTTIDASMEIDTDTALETIVCPADGTTGSSSPSRVSSSKALALVPDQQLNLGFGHSELNQPTEDLKLEEALAQRSNQHDLKGRTLIEETMHVDDRADMLIDNSACPAIVGIECGSSDQKLNSATEEVKANNTTALIAQTEALQNEVAPSTEIFMQSLECLPEFASESNKGDNEYFDVNSKLQNVTGFEELGLDDLEYSFPEGQESTALPGGSFDLANDSGMKEGLSSAGLNSEEVILKMDGGHQLTTLCVWCRSEFKLEAIDSETQSDTIGYMCPTCKDKISGLS